MVLFATGWLPSTDVNEGIGTHSHRPTAAYAAVLIVFACAEFSWRPNRGSMSFERVHDYM